MKITLNLFVCLFTIIVSAQDINQLDNKGERHGIWKKNYENTEVSRYEGEFLHGKEIGLFKFYKNVNGRAVLAATKQFNRENKISQVKFFASTGKVISEGQMNGRAYIGKWIYYHNKSNEILSIDLYNNEGLLNGERLVYYENAVLAQKELYANGKLQGKSIWYNEAGVVTNEYNYDNGELHGEAKTFDTHGSLIVEGQYQRDRKHGIWKYYKNDSLVKEKDFTRYSKNPYKKKD